MSVDRPIVVQGTQPKIAKKHPGRVQTDGLQVKGDTPMYYDWKTAVLRALARLMKKHPARVQNECFIFTRQELIEDELSTIITETASTAKDPGQSLTFILEELRAMSIIRPLEPEKGIYEYDRNRLIEGTWVKPKD